MNRKLIALPVVAALAGSALATPPALNVAGSITAGRDTMITQLNALAPALFGLAVVIAIFVFALNWVRKLARGR